MTSPLFNWPFAIPQSQASQPIEPVTPRSRFSQPPNTIDTWITKVTGGRTDIESVIGRIKEIPKIDHQPRYLRESDLADKLRATYVNFQIKHYKSLFSWIFTRLPSPKTRPSQDIILRTSSLKFLYETLVDAMEKMKLGSEDYKILNEESKYKEIRLRFKELLRKGLVNR